MPVSRDLFTPKVILPQLIPLSVLSCSVRHGGPLGLLLGYMAVGSICYSGEFGRLLSLIAISKLTKLWLNVEKSHGLLGRARLSPPCRWRSHHFGSSIRLSRFLLRYGLQVSTLSCRFFDFSILEEADLAILPLALQLLVQLDYRSSR